MINTFQSVVGGLPALDCSKCSSSKVVHTLLIYTCMKSFRHSHSRSTLACSLHATLMLLLNFCYAVRSLPARFLITSPIPDTPPPPPGFGWVRNRYPPPPTPPWSSRRVILFFTPRNANFAQNCKNSIRLFGVFLLWRPMVKRSKSGVFRKQSFLV